MAAEDALLSIDAVEELRSIFDEANFAVSGQKKSRRLSIFAKSPFVPPLWAQMYFARFVHIASSELATKSKPAGLGAILMILAETRALILDVYDVKKVNGDSSAKIFEQINFLMVAVQKLETVLDRVTGKDKLNDMYKQVNVMGIVKTETKEEVEGKDEDLPLFVLAPQLMLEQRLFPPLGEPGGWDHSELFRLYPEIQDVKKLMHSSLRRGCDETTCLLLTTNAVGTLTMRVLEKTNLRHRYYEALISCFNFCRMAAWAQLKHTYGVDLATSMDWKGVSAFDDKVIHRRRSSVNLAPSPSQSFSQLSPPPLSSSRPSPPPPGRYALQQQQQQQSPPGDFPDRVFDEH